MLTIANNAHEVRPLGHHILRPLREQHASQIDLVVLLLARVPGSGRDECYRLYTGDGDTNGDLREWFESELFSAPLRRRFLIQLPRWSVRGEDLGLSPAPGKRDCRGKKTPIGEDAPTENLIVSMALPRHHTESDRRTGARQFSRKL